MGLIPSFPGSCRMPEKWCFPPSCFTGNEPKRAGGNSRTLARSESFAFSRLWVSETLPLKALSATTWSRCSRSRCAWRERGARRSAGWMGGGGGKERKVGNGGTTCENGSRANLKGRQRIVRPTDNAQFHKIGPVQAGGVKPHTFTNRKYA